MRPSPTLRLQATRLLRSSSHPDPKNGIYMGGWGDLGMRLCEFTEAVTLGISGRHTPTRILPKPGTLNAAIFNTFRRTRHQILYWLPPMLLGYATMEWAIEKNEYYNSKPGRLAGLAP